MESDRLTLLQNFPLKPLQAQGMTIWGETKPRGEQVVDCSFPFGDETGIEEQFHRRYFKVMCQVVDMNREGTLDLSFEELNVKVAEWHRVRDGRRGKEKDCDEYYTHPHGANFSIPSPSGRGRRALRRAG